MILDMADQRAGFPTDKTLQFAIIMNLVDLSTVRFLFSDNSFFPFPRGIP